MHCNDFITRSSQYRKPAVAVVLLPILLILLVSCQVGTGSSPGNPSGAVSNLTPPPNFTRGLIVTSAPAPLYPQRARSLGLEGWVMLSFSVDEEGHVVPGSVEIADQQPPGYFESSALSAVRRMNFENTSNRLIDDVRYVFRYELEERDGSIIPPVAQQPQFRELIPMRFITPDYPPAAEQQGLEGYVVVNFTVTETGQVEDVSVVESDQPGVFDEQALIAARRLRFAPRLVEEQPVRVEGVTYRFDWRLSR